MKIEGDELVFSTGKRVSANCGIIGIDAEGEVFGGFDDGIDTEELTLQEKHELCDYVIAQWQKWMVNNA